MSETRDMTATLAELQRLVAAATPAPWELYHGAQLGQIYSEDGAIGDVFAVADGELIVALRNVLPALAQWYMAFINLNRFDDIPRP